MVDQSTQSFIYQEINNLILCLIRDFLKNWFSYNTKQKKTKQESNSQTYFYKIFSDRVKNVKNKRNESRIASNTKKMRLECR